MSATTIHTPSGVEAHLEGSGPLLVLLAGFGQTSQVWSGLLPRLSSQHTCVRIDNRGVGQGAGRGPVSIELMAQDVADVLTEIGGTASILGWSMGGAVAQTVALTRPDLVDSLVLISTSARRSHVQRLWTQGRLALSVSGADRETVETVVLPWLFSARTLSDHRRLAAIARTNAAQAAVPHVQLQAQADAFERFDVEERLRGLETPVLVIVGVEDVITPVSDSVAIALAAPHAELVVLPQGGHAVVLESPADVVAPVLRFLRGTEAERPPSSTDPVAAR